MKSHLPNELSLTIQKNKTFLKFSYRLPAFWPLLENRERFAAFPPTKIIILHHHLAWTMQCLCLVLLGDNTFWSLSRWAHLQLFMIKPTSIYLQFLCVPCPTIHPFLMCCKDHRNPVNSCRYKTISKGTRREKQSNLSQTSVKPQI